MPSTTVRISERGAAILRELAASYGVTMTDVLDRAIEGYRRQAMFDEADRAFAALWDDPEAARLEREERSQWDAVLADGLDDYADG